MLNNTARKYVKTFSLCPISTKTKQISYDFNWSFYLKFSVLENFNCLRYNIIKD